MYIIQPYEKMLQFALNCRAVAIVFRVGIGLR